LIAIDEAHPVYDWQDFRQNYKRCEELHVLFPNIPLMALSEDALKSFMHDPLVERSSVNRSNIYLAVRYAILRSQMDLRNLFP